MGEEEIQLKIVGRIIEVEGIRFEIGTIRDALRNPPNKLFSVKRVGDELIFTQYGGAEVAAKFFEDNPTA